MKDRYDLVVVGGGPAGLAAAISAYNEGVKSILLIERDCELGGILNQCIHNGFGLHHFKEELTGPEYAQRFVKQLAETDVEVMLDTMVLDISSDRVVTSINKTNGYMQINATAIILAMGCRERTRGAISIPGTRPSGVMTAGAAQRFVNMQGDMVGKRIVILGSGDIGLIMARRMTLEGATVLACVELMPYSGGLNRNIVQCLHDYDIPLYLSHTITEIKGRDRVSGVTIAKVDENRNPIDGSEIELCCDTILLSVGLIPENELSKSAGVKLDGRTNGAVVTDTLQTSIEGIFACGNVLHVHDLVDFVTAESQRAGVFAARYIHEKSGDNYVNIGFNIRDSAVNKVSETTDDSVNSEIEVDSIVDKSVNIGDTLVEYIDITTGDGVSYTVPQKFNVRMLEDRLSVYFRVRNIYKDVAVMVKDGDRVVARFKREHVAPGEMEQISIPKKLLNGVTSLEVKLERLGG